jgi:hypothetical protein
MSGSPQLLRGPGLKPLKNLIEPGICFALNEPVKMTALQIVLSLAGLLAIVGCGEDKPCAGSAPGTATALTTALSSTTNTTNSSTNTQQRVSNLIPVLDDAGCSAAPVAANCNLITNPELCKN